MTLTCALKVSVRPDSATSSIGWAVGITQTRTLRSAKLTEQRPSAHFRQHKNDADFLKLLVIAACANA